VMTGRSGKAFAVSALWRQKQVSTENRRSSSDPGSASGQGASSRTTNHCLRCPQIGEARFALLVATRAKGFPWARSGRRERAKARIAGRKRTGDGPQQWTRASSTCRRTSSESHRVVEMAQRCGRARRRLCNLDPRLAPKVT